MAKTPLNFGSRFSAPGGDSCMPAAAKKSAKPKHSTARLMLHAKLARNMPLK